MSSNRVALYLVSYSGGGAEREMIYLANEFAERGYIVDLIVHRDAGPLEPLISDAVNKVVIDKTYLHDVFKLSQYMRVNKPLFVLSSLHMPNWTLALSKILSFTKTRIIWRVVNNLSKSRSTQRGGINSLLGIFYPILSSVVDRITCVSNGVAEDLVSNFSVSKSKVEVMYNPAYSEVIHELAKEEVSHKWFNSDFQTVVSLGRLHVQKDYATLITSFKAVAQQNKKARLVIFGDGVLHDELQKLIESHELSHVVELYGFELNPYKYLAKSDLFVLSSIYEGFGNVIVEALALNIPVVSTNCPSGPSEILNGGEWGRLVSVGDKDELASAIISSLNNTEKSQTLSRAKEFSVSKVASDYINIINVD